MLRLRDVLATESGNRRVLPEARANIWLPSRPIAAWYVSVCFGGHGASGSAGKPDEGYWPDSPEIIDPFRFL